MPGERDEPREDEQLAFAAARRVLDAGVEPLGRHAPIDALLTFPDGRRGAFEVVALAAEGALQLDSLLGQVDSEWPSKGDWWWTVQVGSVRDLPRLEQCYPGVVALCEKAGVSNPEVLWHVLVLGDKEVPADLHWLVLDSHPDTGMWGYPDVPAVTSDRVRNVMVTPAGRGSIVDEALTGLHAALRDVFAVDPLAKHLRKLAGAAEDERHLFVVLHRSALPFGVLDALMLGTSLPPDPPPLPPEVTHLWLAPTLSRRVLLWRGDAWEQHWPYDEP